MKIEVWSDFVCPFCYVGKRQLELALEQCSYRDNVFVQFKSFQLDLTESVNYHELLASQYHLPVDHIEEANERLHKQAAEVGLQFNFSNVHRSNTFDAHRLMNYAINKQKGSKLAEKLFQAYFTDSRQLSDHLTLLQLAEQVGLNEDDVTEILETRKYTNAVREDIDMAIELDVKTVPFYVFNEKYALSGVQSLATLNEVLTTVWEEECSTRNVRSYQAGETYYCSGDDNC